MALKDQSILGCLQENLVVEHMGAAAPEKGNVSQKALAVDTVHASDLRKNVASKPRHVSSIPQCKERGLLQVGRFFAKLLEQVQDSGLEKRTSKGSFTSKWNPLY